MVLITLQGQRRRCNAYSTLAAVLAASVLSACGGAAGDSGARVQAKPQNISFASAPALQVAASATVSAQASSGLAVRFSSLTPTLCSVDADSGAVSGLLIGACNIAAHQSGNEDFAPAPPSSLVLTVSGRSQRIGLQAPGTLVVGALALPQASADSGLPLRFSSLTPATCGVDSDTGAAKGLAAGTCRLRVEQAGDAQWAAALSVEHELLIERRPQALELAVLPALQVGALAQVQAQASSGLAVTLTSLSPSICTVSPLGAVLTGMAAGTCTLAADQPGDEQWAPASQMLQSTTVSRLTQGLGFDLPVPPLMAGAGAQVRAQAGSGLPVSYSSLTPDACSISAAGLVSSLRAGSCTVAANQAGDAQWMSAAQAVQTLLMQPRAQSLAFAAAPLLPAGGNAQVGAHSSAGLAVSYSSLTPSTCSISASGLVTSLAAGTCTVAAHQAGDAIWAAAAQVSLSLGVTAKAQSISFAAAPSLTAGASAQLRAEASSGLAVSYSSLTPSTCSISPSGLLTSLTAGSCTAAAHQAGDAIWAAAAQVSQTLLMQGKAQSISFGAAPALTVGGQATLRAAASSGLAIVYSSLTAAVCSVDAASGTLRGLASGSCSVAATQAGDSMWLAAAPANQTLTVGPNPVQTLSFAAVPGLSLGGMVTVRATASSGLSVVYSSLSPSVCSVHASSGQVSAAALGDCVIAANQTGNGAINPAPQVTQTLAVSLPAGVTVPGTPQSVTAKLGSSGSQVSVSVGAINSGGSPITGYTVVSSPAGISATATSAPVSVTCPASCAGYSFAIYASNIAGQGTASAAVPVLTTFDVLSTFYEPDTQPRNSVFAGSFTLNSSTGAITNLSGKLTESMSGNALGSAPFYDMIQIPLSFQLQTWRDAALGGTFVASFAKNSTSTFSTMGGGDGWSPKAGVDIGGVYAGFPAAYAGSVKNSYILIFVPDNPFAPLSAAQIAKLAYADCAPGGMMGAVCMTATSVAGYGSTGTMSGYPVSQSIIKR